MQATSLLPQSPWLPFDKQQESASTQALPHAGPPPIKPQHRAAKRPRAPQCQTPLVVPGARMQQLSEPEPEYVLYTQVGGSDDTRRTMEIFLVPVRELNRMSAVMEDHFGIPLDLLKDVLPYCNGCHRDDFVMDPANPQTPGPEDDYIGYIYDQLLDFFFFEMPMDEAPIARILEPFREDPKAQFPLEDLEMYRGHFCEFLVRRKASPPGIPMAPVVLPTRVCHYFLRDTRAT